MSKKYGQKTGQELSLSGESSQGGTLPEANTPRNTVRLNMMVK
jgi:hypothetical protein